MAGIRCHQVVLQVSGIPDPEMSELLPDRDGSRSGSWGVHGTLTEEYNYHEAINSKDSNQDYIPDDWPTGLTFMPEYIFVDNVELGNYIDFHLKAGNGATQRTDHYLVIYTQTLEEDPTDAAYYKAMLYQGNPATTGTLIYDSGPSYAFGDGYSSYPNDPMYESVGEGTVLDIPEGYAKNITDYSDLWVRIYLDPSRYETPLDDRVAIGRIVLRYPAAPIEAEGPGYTSLWISGIDWTDKILDDTLEITKSLQERSTLSGKLKHEQGTRILPGEEVYFYYEDHCVFGGRVESVEEEIVADFKSTSPVISSIRCMDWARVLDRFTIADSWENETLAEIVRQIFEQDAPELVNEEGFVLGTIADFDYDKVNFRREKVSTCLRELCDLAGMYWYIHPYTRTLTIREFETYAAPWTIGDGYQDYRNLTFSRSLDQYRNVQWLVAGKGETTERTEYFHGHPSTDQTTRPRTFNLSYPCAKVPTIYVDRGAGDVLQRVGIRGVDKDGTGDDGISPIVSDPLGWKQWFWARDENEITQQSVDDGTNNPTLDTDDVLKVTYIGLFPLVGYERNTTGISERAAAEGDSGIYEWVEEDEKVESLPLAEERCLRLLKQFGRVPATFKYEIDKYGLEPGMLQDIVISGHGVNSQYMVEEITITFPKIDLSIFRCRVQALDGEKQDGWIDFWRKSQKAGRKFSLRENEIVGISQIISETVSITETFTDSVNGSVTIPDWDDDPFSVALYGEITVSSIRYPKARYGRSRYGAPISTS